MKPVTKLQNRITTMLRRFDVMLTNCGVIVILPIYYQCGAIWKQDSGCIACKLYIFIINILLSY